MKKVIITLTAVVIITALFFYAALCGFLGIPKVSEGVSLGLDLVGGSEIVYEAVIPEGTSSDEVASGMETAQTMLRQRLNNLGYTEANVYLSGSDRVVVEIPNVDDPEEAVQMLGTTALIQFRDHEGNIILEGKDVTGATAAYGQISETSVPEYYVSLQLSEEGSKKFKEATAKIAGYGGNNNYVAIYMDDAEISTPYVDPQYKGVGIDTSTPIISLGRDDSREYAQYLADIIAAGHLPFELKDTKLQSVGASLGERSLETSIFAGIIGVILVMLYMVIIYRVPGLVADLALLLYIGLFLVVLTIFHVNLSLPGIAGIILTIGMAVDANVIIFERLREELMLGKTLRSSVQSGFKRAYTAIIDSNVTTIIAAIVLLWQGTGTILGFAQTLLIGVILSMACMLIVPNLILKSLAELPHKSLRAYGAR
ncbi:MAG: protein translocase subunit SecD [Clostridiales bacterium]|jgi:protein-export membrane protein SecD|nr:protein translocase subunit SecD [Clostridiales bacterium]